jgi:tripartite-type tricarboxylate transporter receptor subunit TctC
MRRRYWLRSVFVFVFTIFGSPVIAEMDTQHWPERQVRMVVTFPAGAANDAAARILADALSKRWGKTIVVENRTGAEGTLGVSSFVASHDDHTLLYSVAAAVTVAPLLIEKLSYDPEQDLVPIVATASIVLTIAVNNAIPAHTLDDLVRVLRAAPQRYAWSSGPTLPHFAFEAFLKRNGLSMNYVAYRDAALPQADLGEGRIQVLFTALQASQSPVRLGKARFLAIANSSRAAAIPDVPTAREAGHPELTIDGLSGLFGWRGMPDTLRRRIAADVTAVMSDPDIHRRIEATGQLVIGGTPAQFESAIAQQRSFITEVAKLIELKPTK